MLSLHKDTYTQKSFLQTLLQFWTINEYNLYQFRWASCVRMTWFNANTNPLIQSSYKSCYHFHLDSASSWPFFFPFFPSDFTSFTSPFLFWSKKQETVIWYPLFGNFLYITYNLYSKPSKSPFFTEEHLTFHNFILCTWIHYNVKSFLIIFYESILFLSFHFLFVCFVFLFWLTASFSCDRLFPSRSRSSSRTDVLTPGAALDTRSWPVLVTLSMTSYNGDTWSDCSCWWNKLNSDLSLRTFRALTYKFSATI